MAQVPPGMLRLPAERAVCPTAEPSQEDTHWLLVRSRQIARDSYYWSCDLRHVLAKKLRRCGVAPSPLATHVKLHVAPKRVLLVRHGQGAHQLTKRDWGRPDPALTAKGEAQVADLHERLKPHVGAVELIAVSPLTRAIQTATGGFDGCSAPYCLLPILRERLAVPSDTGRTRTELLRCFPRVGEWEGAAEMPEVWWSTETEWNLLDRVAQVKRWVLARPETTIALVGHGCLFQRLLDGHFLENCGFAWTEFSETD